MKKTPILLTVIFACIIMGIVDSIICPGYIVKSIIKLVLFLLIPVIFSIINPNIRLTPLLKPDKSGVLIAAAIGLALYFIILGAYFIFKDIFDFSGLTTSLTSTTGVNKTNFLWVAIYISFINSFLEEFFFRGFSFIILKKYTTRKFAYFFSSIAFSLYHIAMMLGWFNMMVILISIVGLFLGGIIFNRFDEKNENIYLSWLIHMFTNFATNTIGFILFAS